MGWMKQGHLSPFHTYGSVRMNSMVWKNTSWRCAIWMKTGHQAAVIPGCRKLGRRRDYRRDNVNCLSPMLKRQNEMRRSLDPGGTEKTYASLFEQDWVTWSSYFTSSGEHFSWMYPNYKNVLLCLLWNFHRDGSLGRKDDNSVLGLRGGLDPCDLGPLQYGICMHLSNTGRLLLWAGEPTAPEMTDCYGSYSSPHSPVKSSLLPLPLASWEDLLLENTENVAFAI